jgi:hypothetical protein
MPTWGWVVIIVGVAVIALAVLAAALRTRRSRRLQQRFGPEYDRTIEQTGDRKAAEQELRDRRARREELEIRELSPSARERYASEWQDVQTRFVDDPGGAVREGDRLVQQVMQDRGYPTDDFDQRAADLSVDHPHVVQNYRAAHTTWAANERGEATTEDLRRALVRYRSLFDELLGVGVADEPVSRDSARER